jgi:hypothetical protein
VNPPHSERRLLLSNAALELRAYVAGVRPGKDDIDLILSVATQLEKLGVRLEREEGIIEALALDEPVEWDGEDMSLKCLLCDVSIFLGPQSTSTEVPHTPDCAWRRAREATTYTTDTR